MIGNTDVVPEHRYYTINNESFMKALNPFRSYMLSLLFSIIIGLLTSQIGYSQAWFNNDWSYRRPVTIPNPAGVALADFQVEIRLTGTNFDFSKALSDGRDIRVTAGDGITPIPYWIELWNQAGQNGIIWVKVPVLPQAGATVYVYCGNSDPQADPPVLVETPPAGPFVKAAENPIVPIGDPYTTDPGRGLLAENIVYDPATSHYWMVFANYRSNSVGLVWSDDPTNPDAWHWHNGSVIAGGNAPHIIQHGGLWYIFYSDRAVATPYPIVVQSSASITGPYGNKQTILQSTEAWETYRVDEPYVFQRSDGKWILVYMGDAGGAVEQVGYAEADDILGPYTKFNSDDPGVPDGLCIPFGPAGTYDAGTVADPWVYEYEGTSYIGYTVSPTTSSPWQTALATTTDWETFTKQGVLVARGTEYNTFRGAVIRIGDEYVFSYTGGEASGVYRMCIATQPVLQDMSPGTLLNNPDRVFDFFDAFDGSGLDMNKWSIANGVSTQASLAGGVLTLTGSTGYIRINGTTPFGLAYAGGSTGYIGETRARHPDQGTVNMIAEFGFAAGTDFLNIIRIADDFPSITHWQRNAQAGSAVTLVNMNQLADDDWHTFRLYRQESPLTAGFQIDNTPVETVTTGVPTGSLPQFLMSYGNGNRVLVDWTRVRKWAGADPVAVVGAESGLLTQWTGAVSSLWSNPGNWTAGVPADWTNTVIQPSANIPLLNSSFSVSVDGSLSILPGAGLTINGNLVNGGNVTIGSTLAMSGSLIVTGTSTGSITYNRQLKSGLTAGNDYHLVAPPVASNTATNTGKITTVYQWSELTGAWTTMGITSVLPGRSYNIRQGDASDGAISFTGPIVSSNITVAASSPYADAIGPGDSYFNRTYAAGRSLANPGGMGWNLLGNPYPSAISVDDFIAANYSTTPSASQFDPNYVALYLFNGTERRYYYLASNTGWPSGLELDQTHVQAGQGFFVLAMNDNSEFTFTRAMQEHSPTTAMLKSGAVDDRWPGLQLKIAHPAGEVITTVVYNENMTAGVDPGYDIGLFKSGQDIEIYTTLALNDNGVNYTRQALPSGSAETLRIPVGIDYQAGGEVTFSATTVPVGGRRFWLEDRTAGIFTDLSLKSYTVTLPANTFGPGRFYLLASANTPTGTEQLPDELADLRIWVSNGRLIIKGAVSEGALCGIYDMNGRKLAENTLTDGELNTVDLPVGIRGVVLVQVTDGMKTTSRKIAVL